MTLKHKGDPPQGRSFYPRTVAAQIAQMSLDFLYQCEEEQLVQIQITSSGEEGFSQTEVRRLIRIQRLCEDLDLDLGAVEVILHLRRQVLDLQTEMEALEQQMRQREQELLNEIQTLRRRLAAEADW